MRRKKKRKLLILVSILLIFCILSLSVILKMRPVILQNSQAAAERILLTAADEAVVSVLRDGNVSYADVVRLSTDSEGRVTSLQVDALNINILKSKISMGVSELVSENAEYHTSIPIGTFLGSEYTAGRGPKIPFTMQLTSTCAVDFQYEFKEAGLNQVIHRVLLHMTITGRLVMAGASDTFTVETSALVAETVIVGATPDAFTEVIESPGSDAAGIINDYGAQAGE